MFVDDLLAEHRGTVVEPVSMPAEAPLFLMYTTGSSATCRRFAHSQAVAGVPSMSIEGRLTSALTRPVLKRTPGAIASPTGLGIELDCDWVEGDGYDGRGATMFGARPMIGIGVGS